MIKAEISKGNTKLEVSGNLLDLAAETVLMISVVKKQIEKAHEGLGLVYMDAIIKGMDYCFSGNVTEEKGE